MKFKIVEIFDSVEGEGIRSGQPVTFIRLAGCNLKCAYCDTQYATEHAGNFTAESLDEIIKRINKNFMRVTITGGEPLIHPGAADLINRLAREGFEINIETNGSVDITEYVKKPPSEIPPPEAGFFCTGHSASENDNNFYNIKKIAYPEKVFFTMDYKLPSSNVSEKMLWRNFKNLRPHDVLKFVVGSNEDIPCLLDVTERLTKIHKKMPHIFIGTVHGKFKNDDLVKIILNEPLLKNARLQLQIHKIIWHPEKRGV